jgi:hypothetical protein
MPPVEQNPEQQAEVKAQATQTGKETVSEHPDQLKRDNEQFLTRTEKLSQAERQRIAERTRADDQNGDLDLMRSGGRSLTELEADRLARHVDLASQFLTREKNQKELSFKVDFQNNDTAEWGLDLTDLLPANILAVDIYDQDNNLVYQDASFAKKGNKTGYFDAAGKEARVQTGFRIVVKKSQPVEALTDRKYGRQAYLNGSQEQEQMVYNAGVGKAKVEARAEAKKQGKRLITDKEFHDKLMTGLISLLNPETWKQFQTNGTFDTSKLGKFLGDLVDQNSVVIDQGTAQVEQQTRQAEQQKIEEAGQQPAQTVAEDQKPEKGEPQASTGVEGLPADKIKLIEVARSHIGSKEFRGKEVSGGTLACALVASTILKDAGVLDKTYLSVTDTENALMKIGWRKIIGKAQAGDVVIWGRTPSRMVDGIAQQGHKHIGIMTGSEFAVNNNSSLKEPVERKVDFNSPRGVYLLRAPA